MVRSTLTKAISDVLFQSTISSSVFQEVHRIASQWDAEYYSMINQNEGLKIELMELRNQISAHVQRKDESDEKILQLYQSLEEQNTVINLLSQDIQKNEMKLQDDSIRPNAELDCEEAMYGLKSENYNDNVKIQIISDHIQSDLKCSICHEILIYSTSTVCGHLFCQYCITRWVKLKLENNEEVRCPLCRIDISRHSVIKIKVLDNFIEAYANNVMPKEKRAYWIALVPSRSQNGDNSFHVNTDTHLDHSSPNSNTSIQETEDIERNESEIIVPPIGQWHFSRYDQNVRLDQVERGEVEHDRVRYTGHEMEHNLSFENPLTEIDADVSDEDIVDYIQRMRVLLEEEINRRQERSS